MFGDDGPDWEPKWEVSLRERNYNAPAKSGLGFVFYFQGDVWFFVGVNGKIIQPPERLQRMRRMFAENGEILAEDDEHFTKQDAPTALNKVPRKSAKSHGRPAPKRN